MADETTTRRCIGSTRFGIEAHDAPVTDFPKQPSQKDGLGRMCKSHWNQYTASLARDAKARKAAAEGAVPEVAPVEVPAPEASAPAESKPSRKRAAARTAGEPETAEA